MRSRLLTAMTLVVGVVWLLGNQPALAQDSATAAEINVKIDGDYGPHLPPALYDETYNGGYGTRVDSLINWLHYFMFALFGGWGIFFVYCLVKFRSRPGHRAPATLIKAKVSKYLEIGVAIFEACLLIGLSLPVWAEVKNQFPPDEDNATRIKVVAEQFAWNFHYPGPDGVFGKTGPEYIDSAVNPLGIDPDDPNGLDDLFSGEMHFPVGRPVIAELTSKDVIHSFFLPVLRVKQDVIPGMRIPVWFKSRAKGNYEIACSQLCGNNHYSMRALMSIHDTVESFEAWLETQKLEDFPDDEFD